MSFLDSLRKKKDNLQHAETLVRYADGTISNEDVYSGNKEFVSVGIGYVVDTKPDLSVAEIISGLFMGSQDVAHLESLLKSNNITHVISLGIVVPKFEGISYTYFEILDVPEFNILDIFDGSFSIIDSVRKKGGAVYIHCNAGVSRSATLTIGYIMKECKMNLRMAHDYVKSKRPCIKPNDGFMKQLLDYEKYL